MNRLFHGFTNCIRPFKPASAPASTFSEKAKSPTMAQVQLTNEQGRSTITGANTTFLETQQEQSQHHQLSKLLASEGSRYPTRTLAQLLKEARREDAAEKSKATTTVGPAKKNSIFAINKKRFNGLFTQTTKPLHEHASHALKRMAEAQYLEACHSPYVWTGVSKDYSLRPANHDIWHAIEDRLNVMNSELSLDKIVRMVASNPNRGNSEVQIMDIGCGHGEFIRAINEPGNIKAYGVTAEGFNRNLESFPPAQFIEGNAQNLMEVLPDKKNSFDVIFSQMTFMHLPDPLGALTQSYELLKPGGIMMVDGFHAPGIEDNIQAINNHLQGKGYEIYFFQEPNPRRCHPIGPVLIRKSADLPTLDLPVKYSDIKKNKQNYKLDYKKIKTPQNKPESLSDTLENFHKFRKKIGISDECLAHAQDPQTQRRLRDLIGGG